MGWQEDLADAVAQYAATQTGGDDEIRPIFPKGFQAGDWAPRFNQPQTPLVSRTRILADGTIEELDTAPIYTYISGEGANYWDQYAPETRKRLEGQMVEAGLLGEGAYQPGASNKIQHDAWEEVLGYANYYGVSPFNALRKLQVEGISMGVGRGGGGGGAAKRTVTTIPDYKTIAQNAKTMLQRSLGRDMEDWEISLTANEMQRLYRKQASQQLKASLAGSGEFEITDPGSVTQAFIDDQYSSELDRLGDVSETSANYKLTMDVLTKGAKMVGT